MPNYYLEGKAFTHQATNTLMIDPDYLRKIFTNVFNTKQNITLTSESANFITPVEHIEEEVEEKNAYIDPLYTPCFRANIKKAHQESESKSSLSTSVNNIELIAHKFNGVWVKFSQPITKQDFESKDFLNNWHSKYAPNFKPEYSKLLPKPKINININILNIRAMHKLNKIRTNLTFVKKLCSDYSSRISNFFFFHWNRHHQATARMIIQNIETNQATYEKNPLALAKFIASEISNLEFVIRQEGSFKRRMDLAIAQLTDGQYLDTETISKDFPSELQTSAELKN